MAITETAIRSYGQRNHTIRKLGYEDYTDYLKSPTWARLRKIALELFGTDCTYCGEKANAVHHAEYSKLTLKGEDLKHLIPVCNGCHRFGEYDDNGVKVHAAVANSRMRKRAKKMGLGREMREREQRRDAVFKAIRQKKLIVDDL